jgi:hypothetical protein
VPSSLDGYLTVIDIARQATPELTNEQAWSVGAQAADLFEEEYGHPPTKDLRTKTSGTGSHCFAVYPPPFHEKIKLLLRGLKAEMARQGRLQLGDDNG